MIETETRGATRIVRLCHGKVSALDVELMQALGASCGEFAGSDARAMVLTGTGAAFSGGADLRRLLEEDEAYATAFVGALDALLRAMLTLEKPVVAAINGHAIAGGCILAAACDRRLMGPRGRIGVTELYVGVPFPPLVMELLAAVYPPQVLRTIVYEGQLYRPEEALALGLVDAVHPAEALLDAAVALADRLGAIQPETFAVTKAQINSHILRRVGDLGGLAARSDAIWRSDAARATMRAFFAQATGKG